MRVFLSGDTQTEWQSSVIERFPDHDFFDPRKLSSRSLKEMADTERDGLNRADIVFAYLNESNPYAFGTCFEIGYAVACKKHVIYVDEKQVSSSKWIAEHPVFAFEDLESALNKLGEILQAGNNLIAETIVKSLNEQDFTVLVQRELDDDLVEKLASRLLEGDEIYTHLMLASKTQPRRWYDWNLGYLLQRLDPAKIAANLAKYPESFYHSEGIAWALGLLHNDDEKIIRFLQEVCQRVEDYDAWWCAAHSLEQLNHGNAIEILKRTLRQPKWQDLDYCLDRLGERPATIGILRRITRDNIDRVINACLRGLTTLSGRRLHNVIWLLERFRSRERKVVDTLMRLHDSPEGHVRFGSSVAHRVVEALGQIAHPDSRQFLEKHLLEAEYFRTRAWAAQGLGLIGDRNSIHHLEGALEREKNPHVLSKVTSALYRLRDEEKRKDAKTIFQSGWLENGMIIDETNKWYWSPDVYDEFSSAEDPKSVCFELALSLRPNNVSRVLDLGAGTGRFIREIQERLKDLDTVYALDNSKEMTEFLERQRSTTLSRSKVKVINASISNIPLKDESVDMVVSSWGFPSRVWDQRQSLKELSEVARVLVPKGEFITIGWDEEFSDEMTEVWYRFVIEDEFCFDTLPEYRRRKKSKITSPRNCHLQVVKRGLRVPVKFSDKWKAARVFGHLFGYTAGIWVLEADRKEFEMGVSITKDTKSSLQEILARAVVREKYC